MTDPVEITLTPEMCQDLEKFRDEHEGEPLGGVGSNVLFEDDRVKIWDMHLKPGEASDLHHHQNDYYLVMLQGDQIAGIPPKDSGVDVFVSNLPPGGTTVFVPKGGTEWAMNTGEETFFEILIELKP